MDREQFLAAAREKGVWFGYAGDDRYRMVTHFWVGDEEIARALEVIAEVLQSA
ncbi:MAG: hypothetical protein N2D54_02705 [Chloroflexota bacterium]